MALVKCVECGKDVSTKAKECPNCGASVQYANRIKWYYWAPVIVIILIAAILINTNPDILKKELSSDVIDNSAVSTLQDPNKQSQAPEEEPKSAEEIRADMKSQCSDEWPNDYSMQEHCNKRQIEAISMLREIYENNPEGSEVHNIMNRCMHEWKDGNTYDYAMVNHCTKRQIESYNRLNN